MAFEKTDATKEPPKDEAPKSVKPEDGEKAAKASKPKADSKPRKARKPGPKTLEAKLIETSQGVATLMIMGGQVHDGVVIYSRSEQLAHAWAQAADQNKTVDRVLRMLTEGGVWGGVVITTTSVALPIMQNHGLLGGVPNPFTLSEQEVNDLPPELQQVVAMYQAAMAEKEAEARAAKTSPGMPGGNGGPS